MKYVPGWVQWSDKIPKASQGAVGRDQTYLTVKPTAKWGRPLSEELRW